MGADVPAESELRRFLGPPLAVTFAEQFGFDQTQIDEAIAHYRRYYHHGGELENSVYEGIPGVLEALQGADVTLAVATSKPTVSATRILEHFDLAGAFIVIAGAELDGSRQHKAEVIAHALQELRAQSPLIAAQIDAGDLHMVGDREHDVIGAATHGIGTIGALWGYGSEAELRSAGAQTLIDHPAALIGEFTARGVIA
jgi:phosphoglycolate phosphatase